MATTGTYGCYIPDNNDLGSVWWPGFRANCVQWDTHNHDGLNSAQLAANAIANLSTVLPTASWSATSGGLYTQTVTLPVSLTEVNNFVLNFFISSGGNTGKRIFPSVLRVTATTYTVIVNDNSMDVTVIYG